MDEREQLIQDIVERLLKILPEVVGNLMAAHAANSKLSADFYRQYPEFKSHTDIVREMIAKVEMSNPTINYDEILKLAIPSIREGIKSKSKVNFDIPNSRPSLDVNGDL